jgi:hypothetical protein
MEKLTMFGKQIVLFGLACSIIIGGEAWGAAGWTSFGTVDELRATSKNRFYVKLNVTSNPTDCRNKEWFYRDYTRPGADYMFRALLGAVTDGKKVRVYVTSICDIDAYSEITSVSVAP